MAVGQALLQALHIPWRSEALLGPSLDTARRGLISVSASPLSFPLLGAQILANVFLYLCAIIVGIMSYYMADRKHRKAFLEARQSLEVKMNLEEQSQQQVRLSGGLRARAWSLGSGTW